MASSLNGARIEDVLARVGQVEALQGELRGHVDAIHDLLAQIGGIANGTGVVRRGRGAARRGRRPGRPRGPVTAKQARRSGKRAPRGALRVAIHRVLAGGKAMRPKDIVAALPKAGYKTGSSHRVVYSSTFISLTKDPQVQKTAEGFRLKTARTSKKAEAKSA